MTDLARTIDEAFQARESIGPSTQGSVRAAVDQTLALLDSGRARAGELVVIVAGAPGGVPGSTNLVRVHRLGEAR